MSETNYVFIKTANELHTLIEKASNAVILCDHNTEKFCLPLLKLSSDIPVISISPGELNKSTFSLNHIWNQLVLHQADRNTVLINLGGGVISDLGGLAAATFNRGIKFINIPTSLMGMVDAANGGKTGINYNGLKNYIGTFTSSESNYIWPEFLATLPFEQIQSGYSEMLKHGLIADKTYFELLISLELTPETTKTIDWLPLIKKSIDIKKAIVESDFKESGKRKVLNFGHTIGHALESFYCHSNLPHGHFVSAGILCETFLSHTLGRLELAESQKIIMAYDKIFNRIHFKPSDMEAIKKLTLKDKKNKNQIIKCVFLEQNGLASIDNEITLKDVEDSLNFYYA